MLPVILVLQALATTLVMLGNRRILNADAVSYLQIAGHYRTGSIGLAVNGYWSPMLCWLIAPGLGLFAEPRWAGWMVTGLSGLGFTIGSWAVFRVLDLDRIECGFAATIVALATATSLRLIAPDWLMSGLLLLGFALLLRHDWAVRPWIALASGLVLGAAYLAKAPALPQGLLAVLGLAVLRWLTIPDQRRQVLLAVGVSLLGLGVIALPWIAVLSVRYGHLTFSTAAEVNHALVGPQPLIEHTHPSFRKLIPPAAGQLTAWEDPSRQAHRSWSPWRAPEAMAYQWKVVKRNLWKTWLALRSFDRLRLGLLAMVVGLLWHRPWRSTLATERWRWTLIPALSVVVPYLPIVIEVRYLYALQPLLLVTALHLARPRVGVPWTRSRTGRTVVSLLLLLSFGGPVLANLLALQRPGEGDHWYEIVQALRTEAITGPVVGDQATSMKVAFLLGQPHLGSDLNLTAEAVRTSGARIVVVQRDSAVAAALARAADYRELAFADESGNRPSQRAFVRTAPAEVRDPDRDGSPGGSGGVVPSTAPGQGA